MTSPTEFDAIVIGSGPNGLSAGIRLAQQGLSVKIFESKETIGGGTRTEQLTEAGFLHDVCSAVHPTAAASPFLNSLPLHEYGLKWIQPDYPFAHPLENGDAVIISKSLEETLKNLGADSENYRQLYSEFVENWPFLTEDIFGTLRFPKHPLIMARFGWYGMFSAKLLNNSMFKSFRTRAMFAGCAAHSILPLDKAFTASFGLIMGTSAHAVGWPIAKKGSASITSAMAEYFKSLGGFIETSSEVKNLGRLPPSKAVLFDLTPRQVVQIASKRLPYKYRMKLERYQRGPGVFKMDWALSEPVPWKNENCRKAGTLHLGGSYDEIARSEKGIWKGEHTENPYVLVSQPSLFDDTRAPAGKHTLWAYCHVPNGSQKDMTHIIEDQIERYAPGFKDIIISKHTMNSNQMEVYNPNYIGGDINGGAQSFKQLFGRPVLKWDPYKIPAEGLYICSSSTPPGGGVHGMCGYHAANSVLKNEFGLKLN